MVGALWIDYRFFTIWAHTLVGLVCAAIALGRVPPHWLTAGPALAIALVAGVYHALLAEGRNLTGLDLVVDAMLHSVVPAGFILFWMFALPKGRLAWRDLLIWSAYPIVYSIYAIVRGTFDGVYPYFFLDVGGYWGRGCRPLGCRTGIGVSSGWRDNGDLRAQVRAAINLRKFRVAWQGCDLIG